MYVDKTFEVFLKGINALLQSLSDASSIIFIASSLWKSYDIGLAFSLISSRSFNISVIMWIILDYVWLQCNCKSSSRTFRVPHKCSFNEHVRPYSIPVAFLLSRYMLSFHELLQYFTRQRFHVYKVLWTIPLIVMMTGRMKIR